jgi:HJR/Mrr/RecB family endonuclease
MFYFDSLADQIHFILERLGMRLKVKHIISCLLLMKDNLPEALTPADLTPEIILETGIKDNQERANQGMEKRFKIYAYEDTANSCMVSIEKLDFSKIMFVVQFTFDDLLPDGTIHHESLNRRIAEKVKEITENFIQQYSLSIPNMLEEDYSIDLSRNRSIVSLIDKSNEKVKSQIKEAINQLSWEEFESRFLSKILVALGFKSFQITQRSRDGGKDAINCQYRDNLVQREAIVSAKHWKSKKVGSAEVQRVRGIKGNADTGIIITSSEFTEPAKTEAEHSQYFRKIVLIDGDRIAETCLKNGIGANPVDLVKLYEFDPISISFD